MSGTYVLPEYAHTQLFTPRAFYRPNPLTGPCPLTNHVHGPLATCPPPGGDNPPSTIDDGLRVIWAETVPAAPPVYTPPAAVAVGLSQVGGNVVGGSAAGPDWNDISPGSTYSLDGEGILIFRKAIQKCGSTVQKAGTSALTSIAGVIAATPKSLPGNSVQIAKWILAGDPILACGALLIGSLSLGEIAVLAAAGIGVGIALADIYAMFDCISNT